MIRRSHPSSTASRLASAAPRSASAAMVAYALAAIAPLATPPSTAAAATYTYTKIGSGSLATTSVRAGEVNAYGLVAYSVNGPPAVRGVYVSYGVGLPIRVIDDNGGQFVTFARPDLNCHGHVVVAVEHANGDTCIVHQAGGSAPTIVYTGQNLGDPSMNDFDSIVFVDKTFEAINLTDPSGFGVNLDPEIVSGDVASLHTQIDIANSGEIAFGVKLTGGGSAIRRSGASGVCNVAVSASSEFKDRSSVVINGQDWAGMFWQSKFMTGICGLAPQVLAPNSVGLAYRSLDMNWWWAPCFIGGSSPSSIYGGPAHPGDILVSAGGTVPGHTGTIAAVWPFGVSDVFNNNSGSVSFAASFTDGTWSVFRADRTPATPEPEGCPGLAPSNDLVQDAIAVGDQTAEFTTVWATTDGGALPEACEEGFGLSLVSDVWFAYTAATSGAVEVSTCATVDYDSRLAVYTVGAEGPDLLIACNDDAPGCGLTSSAQFEASAGETYLVRVGGYSGWGSGTIHFGRVTAADLNGDGVVDGADLGQLLANWGSPGAGDLNGDGSVDGADLGLLLSEWN